MAKKYIDAEAFFKLINTTLPYGELDYPDKAVYNAAISDMCDMLTHFPAADVQEIRRGRWLHLHLDPDNITGHTKGECSICGKLRIVDNYCPNCGTRMEVE